MIKYYFTSEKFQPKTNFPEKKWKPVAGKKAVRGPKLWSEMAVRMVAEKYFRKNETSVHEMIERVVSAIGKAGSDQGHFKNAKAKKTFLNELSFILLSQRAFFNSPVWFNLGVRKAPQCSACFIQSIDDSLDSIFDLLKMEARIFKYGSGSGTNFSKLRSRSEELAGGGFSSGLISFLEVFDRAAGAVKSGGTSRRAAKMVCIDVDHPEIREFIQWKMKEEKKAQALIQKGYPSGYEDEAYKTVSGQNSNNSIRVTDAFMKAVQEEKSWALRERVSRKIVEKVSAADLWKQISESAWYCADPGVQFHDTINQWHTCAQTSTINASNPCSEYMFIDDSACNLASINLTQFLKADDSFDVEGFRQTVRVVFLAQEILIDLAGYPTEKIRKNSHDYRPLGMGFTNLGSLLMQMAIPYDSEKGRGLAASITSLMTSEAYKTSALIARAKGPFAAFQKNKKSVLNVLKKHSAAHLKLVKSNGSIQAELLESARENWNEILKLAQKSGLRNAQATAIAPTGTISFAMDAETTGIEPEFSLKKYKKLVGGEVLELVNQSALVALKKLGYSDDVIAKVKAAIMADGHLGGIADRGLIRSEHRGVVACAVGAEQVSGAHSGGVHAATVGAEGANYQLSPQSHVSMLAAVQPFVSGAISKTVNMPSSASEKDIRDLYLLAWRLGIKSLAIYRDGSKSSQPLNVSQSPEELRANCMECA